MSACQNLQTDAATDSSVTTVRMNIGKLTGSLKVEELAAYDTMLTPACPTNGAVVTAVLLKAGL